MSSLNIARGFALASAFCILLAPVVAQDQMQVVIDRSLTEEIPYTLIYPSVMPSIDDGSTDTILTISRPDIFAQCDLIAVPDADAAWSAQAALEKLDVAGIESNWTPAFPGFRITDQAVNRIASGDALVYRGSSASSPLSIPANVVHVEVVDSGRRYTLDCVYDQAFDADTRPVIDFIIANFSTRSDGECCVGVDNRG
jgi:hypothetical protein